VLLGCLRGWLVGVGLGGVMVELGVVWGRGGVECISTVEESDVMGRFFMFNSVG